MNIREILQITWSLSWRAIVAIFAFIGMVEWYFTVIY